jgi:Flp pilus assembly protein TadB
LWLFVVLLRMLSAGTELVAAEPPARFAHERPDAVLVASRNSGLAVGATAGLFASLPVGLAFGLTEGLSAGLLIGLFFVLVIGLPIGLMFGLDAWLYHYWLRWRLRARGLLPARLPAFLEWCARDERGWLRITDAYEFRHRELLEHLAPSTARVHARGSSADVGAPSAS